jgi:hypothetical protein
MSSRHARVSRSRLASTALMRRESQQLLNNARLAALELTCHMGWWKEG